MFIIRFFRRSQVARHTLFWLLYAVVLCLFNRWRSPVANFLGVFLLCFPLAGVFYATFGVLWMMYRNKSRWLLGSCLLLLIPLGVYFFGAWYLNDFMPLTGGHVRKAWVRFSTERYAQDFIMAFSRMFGYAVIYFLIKVYARERQKRQEEKIKRLRAQRAADLQALNAGRLEREKLRLVNRLLLQQINPHFLGNFLSFVADRANKYDDEILSASVMNVADMLRYITHCSKTNDPTVFLDREFGLVKEVVKLMQALAGSPEAVILREEGNPGALVIPPLSLLTILENVHKHGVYSVAYPVRVEAIFGPDSFTFICANTMKKPILRDAVPEGGIGLSNLEQRFYRVFGDRFSLNSEIKEQVYEIRLMIRY